MATKYVNTKYTLLDRAKRTADGKRVLDIIRVMDELVDDFYQDVLHSPVPQPDASRKPARQEKKKDGKSKPRRRNFRRDNRSKR